MKGKGPIPVEKHAGRVVPRTYHLQSPNHWFQEKGNKTCTEKDLMHTDIHSLVSLLSINFCIHLQFM